MPSEMFNFDQMSKMAKEDPEALELWLREQVEELIESAPEEHRHRLRGLQFTIDMERKKCSNPMSACIRLSEMMHESFAKLRESLGQFQSAETFSVEPEPEKMVADVIPFGRQR